MKVRTLLDGISIDEKQFSKWLVSLRSGTFDQGRYVLESAQGMCCLGVACKTLIPKSKQHVYPNGTLIGRYPNDQRHSPKWLDVLASDFAVRTGQSLLNLNDDGFYVEGEVLQFNFIEIAEILEAIYVDGVLEAA